MILEKKTKTKQKQTRQLQKATVWSCEPDVWMERDADVLCLSKLSPKKNPNPCAESAPTPSPPQPRHSLRRGQDWLSFKKPPEITFLSVFVHYSHNSQSSQFFSVASDFKLTSDGEKKLNERKEKQQPACYLHVTLQLFTLIKRS